MNEVEPDEKNTVNIVQNNLFFFLFWNRKREEEEKQRFSKDNG